MHRVGSTRATQKKMEAEEGFEKEEEEKELNVCGNSAPRARKPSSKMSEHTSHHDSVLALRSGTRPASTPHTLPETAPPHCLLPSFPPSSRSALCSPCAP